MTTTIPIDDAEAAIDRVYRCNAELRDELAGKDMEILRLKEHVLLLEDHIAGLDRIIATWERAYWRAS